MKSVFIFFNIFFMLIAPIILVLGIKEAYKFFTSDWMNASSWEEEFDPIGAWAVSNLGITYYFSLGEWEDDADTDNFGFPDEHIAFYVDELDEIVGTEFGDGEYVVSIVEINH